MISPRFLSLLPLAAGLLFPLQALAAPPPLPTPILPDGLGVNIHFTDPRPGEMKMLAAGGFKWIRMDFAWDSIEKVKGVYDFSAYDRLLAALAPYDIRAIFILDYGNDLYDKGESPRTEEARQAFAQWAAASARHFAGRGILWEMFNEPNGGFWKPAANVNEYIQLALAVGKALHDATPSETYIGPATSTLDFPFLEACFKAGLLQYWTAVSVHPYRGNGPETAAPEYRRLRLLIAKYAPPGKSIPIISGEWGYSSPQQGNLEKRVYVFGAVAKPSAYTLTNNERVLDALAAAGGITPAARIPGAILVRRGTNRKVQAMPLHLSLTAQKLATPNNDALQPNDVLYVPDTKMSDAALQQALNGPMLGLLPSLFKSNDANEQQQGKMLPRQWLSNLSNNIVLSIWYDWHDDGLSPTDPEHHFGTVHNPYFAGRDPVYDPKPAYIAAKTLTTELDGFRFNKRLWTGREEDYVLLFSKGRDVRLAVWTTNPTPHEINLPKEFGRFGVTDHLGTAAGSFNAPRQEQSPNVPSSELTDAPKYLDCENNRGFTQPMASDFLRIAGAWERAPLEIMAHAPTQARISLSLRNPLDTPIDVNTEAGRVHINPHAIHFFPQTVDVTRDARPIPVLLNLNVEGYGTITQRTEIVVTNPLNVTLLPITGNEIPVHILNPTGEAFTGSVHLNSAGNAAPYSQTLPLQLATGEVDTTLHFSIPAGSPQNYSASGAVLDSAGKTVLSIPPARFHLLDDFGKYTVGGQPGSYKLIPDGDPKVASDQELSVNSPPDNPTPGHAGALRLTYRFDAGWKFLRLTTGRPDLNVIEGKPRALGLWVYGDGQGNSPRMRFTDATGQTFQPAAEDITWQGWRYVSFPMDGYNAGRWGGANDGVIHYPIHLDTLFLLDGNNKATHGQIYLSAPTWVW